MGSIWRVSCDMVNLIFDFDGTLYNSYKGIKMAFESSAIQVYQSGVEFKPGNIGPPIAEIHEIYFKNKTPYEKKQFINTFRNLYDYEYCDQGEWYDGAKDLHTQLNKEHFRLICLTNKPFEPLQKILLSQSIGIEFDMISCIDDKQFKSNYKSERLKMIKNLTHNSAEKWVYIGDTQEDYEAALKNNCIFVHASYGYGIVDGKNLLFINSLRELLSVLDNVLS
ncbi:HAD family hydrolase [Arsenicibacter rosenii]|uniref:phosphoglycolate phosphatase n=1 Tax=Arsenicibacter rosenii TaxID=1750698 RepID=A0A1S2VEP0_9BACT|nr:HAD family hydrolase [Arsenicibacter rosenii]OIN56368.1 hypothetical protein BLX24_25405 [Arsenicibacter rosenii]